MAKMFKGAFTGVLTAVALTVAGAAAKAETLTDALILAYRNSDLLEQNRALLRATDENVAQAVAALRPVLAFVADTTYRESDLPLQDNTSSSMALSASLTLYDGGNNKLALEAAKESVLATRAQLVGIEQGVLLSAVQAYMDVRSASETVALGQSNVRLITEQLRAARDRFEVGEVTRTDVSQAEARLATSQSSLVVSQGQLAVAQEAYRAVVGQKPGTLAPVTRLPSLPKSVDEARAIAQRTHPDIKAAQHNVTVSELTLLRARAIRGPSVDATASLSQSEGGLNNSSVGLELRQTIYSGGALKSGERQALANRDASLSSLHRTVRLVEQEVGNASANLSVARAQILASDKAIRAAQLAFEGTREEARLGARTTLDVLDAEQELLDARTTRVQAVNNQNVAIYALLSSMGLLTVEHLNLGIPTYDPAEYYNAVKNAPVRSVQGDRLDQVLKSIGKK